MLVEARAVRGDVAETSFDGVHRVLPQRTEPSGEGKCPTLSQPEMTTVASAIVLNAGNVWAAYCGITAPPHE